jgi:hypothetical protein
VSETCWSNISFTSNFDVALARSNEFLDLLPLSTAEEVDDDLARLRARLIAEQFSVQESIEDNKDLAFHLSRCGKLRHGIITLRKSAICRELIVAIRDFVTNGVAKEIVLMNGCDPLMDNPQETVDDFWLTLNPQNGTFYMASDSVKALFENARK